MDFGWDDGMSTSWYVNTDGYPGDKNPHTMWHSFDFISEVDDLYFYVNLDVVPGDSGSPVYLYLEDQDSTVQYGIISSQVTKQFLNFPDVWNTHTNYYNQATRITQDRFNQICGWIDAGIC
jgi:V8-like Glu-specific endopeptidase